MNRKRQLSFAMALLFTASVPSFAGDTAVSSANLGDYTAFRLGDVANAKFNALLQGWAVANQNTTTNDQNYRLRRAEVKVSGTIMGYPKYVLMVDPAKLVIPPGGKSITTSAMIQDFGLSYAVLPGLEISAGQFKIPTTAEGLDSSSELPLPERSLVGRTFGDKREMGVKASYRANLFNATAMVSSGRHVSTSGQGAFHDLDTRVEFTPTKNVSFGTFGVIGNDFNYSSKGRWGVNARYNLGQTVLRAEYAQAKDGAIQSQGVTTEIGYWLTENFEPIVRYETFSPSQSVAKVSRAESIGLNYLIREYNTKMQVAGTAMQNMSAVNGSPSVAKAVNNQEVTLALQTTI